MAGRSALNAEMWVSPSETLRERLLLWQPIYYFIVLWCNGNIPLFESEDSRFDPWRDNWEVNSRLGCLLRNILAVPPFLLL
jgi:hypothetical protein